MMSGRVLVLDDDFRFYLSVIYILFSVFQSAQRRLREILNLVKTQQKGGMVVGHGPSPQGMSEMGSPKQDMTQDHQPRRK